MMRLSSKVYKDYKRYPEKVVQFGEGNFLRAFADWMIDEMNEKGVFNGSVVVVQPLRGGLVDKLNEQDGLYTLILQGIKDGKAKRTYKVVNSISRGINPYDDYEAFLNVAESETIRFVISNTTEAGIAFDENDTFDAIPHNSFPAKLTAFMYRRYKYFNGSSDKGLIILPCELIDRNGEKLKEMVLKYVDYWNLEKGFADWVLKWNVFCTTLVDRIVTGYPKDDAAEIEKELGYEDSLIDVGELFHLWVIEGPKWIEKEFPAREIGLNVRFVDDVTPYRDRKVRILNGLHTTMVPVAYLYGIDTVGEAMEDDVVGKFIKDVAYDEIMKTLDLPDDEVKEFIGEVFDRFKNPYVKHYLMSIALNSMSKYETRVLPSLLQYVKAYGELPKKLVFSLSAYIEFYKGKRGDEAIPLSDDPDILKMYQELWKDFDGSHEGIKDIVTNVLSYDKVWKMDLNEVAGLNDAVTEYLYSIEKNGIKESLKEVLK